MPVGWTGRHCPPRVPDSCALDDASLGELLARLAGRWQSPLRPNDRGLGSALADSTNRLAMSAPLPLTRIEANLAQLAADLADQTDRLRRLIATAESGLAKAHGLTAVAIGKPSHRGPWTRESSSAVTHPRRRVKFGTAPAAARQI